MKTTKRWQVFLILWIASIFGTVAIIPYSLALQSSASQQAQLPMPLWLLIPIQVGINAVLFALVIGLGLVLATRINLGLPILQAFLNHERVQDRIKPILLPSVVLGVLSSVVIVALDVFLFMPLLQGQANGLPSATLPSVRPAAWQGFFASFYGGIDEELVLRLFFLSLLAFLGKFLSHTSEGYPTLAVLWGANIVAAVVFGLGHLPMTSVLVSISPLIVTRAIVLNGLAGLAFGYLYFT